MIEPRQNGFRFEEWLGGVLRRPPDEVELLLSDPRGVRFLIAWSLFEAKRFGRFAKKHELRGVCQTIVEDGYDVAVLEEITYHFHDRYQDNDRFRHLLYGDSCPDMQDLLGKPYDELSDQDRLFICVFTTYRYRNNIFHGNKPVQDWLMYKDQIDRCIEVMASLVSDVEAKNPSLAYTS
jgi:hypothetical protein